MPFLRRHVIQHKDAQKENICQKMQRLTEDQAKRRKLTLSQHKAYKERMSNLKAKQVLQDNLGLEIRKIHCEKLQFVFRNISPSDPKRAYTFIMGLKENGILHQAIHSLNVWKADCRRLNNFSVFIVNIRKEFASLAHL